MGGYDVSWAGASTVQYSTSIVHTNLLAIGYWHVMRDRLRKGRKNQSSRDIFGTEWMHCNIEPHGWGFQTSVVEQRLRWRVSEEVVGMTWNASSVILALTLLLGKNKDLGLGPRPWPWSWSWSWSWSW
jgi:hypothetical protein